MLVLGEFVDTGHFNSKPRVRSLPIPMFDNYTTNIQLNTLIIPPLERCSREIENAATPFTFTLTCILTPSFTHGHTTVDTCFHVARHILHSTFPFFHFPFPIVHFAISPFRHFAISPFRHFARQQSPLNKTPQPKQPSSTNTKATLVTQPKTPLPKEPQWTHHHNQTHSHP